jgi:sulfofructose kinase
VDVVGLGLNAMDTICVVDRLPQSNTKSPIRQVRFEPGGQVATALATCSRFGLTTRYIGSVGNDEPGKAQLQSLLDCGLGTDFVRVVDGATTQIAVILVEDGVGERTILWHHDPRLRYPAEHLQPEMVRAARILHLDGCDSAAALRAAQWAREAGVPVVVDIDELYDHSTEELLRTTDYLIAAEDFSRSIFGELKVEDAVAAIRNRYGCFVAGITLGERGAVFAERNRVFHSPGFKVPVADTTGAGDVFHGAFIYGVLQRWNLEDIACFANAAAALKCTRIGARRGIPSLQDALSLAKRF